MTAASDPPIRDAATVVVLRREADRNRVLMGMRGAQAAFMPSKFVFPGGAVDPSDISDEAVTGALAARLRPDGGPPAALAACARREMQEETGLTLRPGAPLRFFFRAITPPGRPRRFDARFFLVDAAEVVGDPDDFSAACEELSHLSWVALPDTCSLDLPFITEVVLAEVARLSTTLQTVSDIPFFDNTGELPQVRRLTC